jgi:hypothetical protein
MDVVIRIALMFFFIQFLVVISIMVVALLLARPEIPVLGGETGPQALRRSFASAVNLPGRAARSVGRVVHSVHFLRGIR